MVIHKLTPRKVATTGPGNYEDEGGYRPHRGMPGRARGNTDLYHLCRPLHPRNESVSALALRFLILTATRTNEILQARWPEIDLEAAV